MALNLIRIVEIEGYEINVVDIEGVEHIPFISVLLNDQVVICNEMFMALPEEVMAAAVLHEIGHLETIKTDIEFEMTQEDALHGQRLYIEGLKNPASDSFHHVLECMADKFSYDRGHGDGLIRYIEDTIPLVDFGNEEYRDHYQDRIRRLHTGDYSDLKLSFDFCHVIHGPYRIWFE